jgi:hypothetical protein
MTGSRLRALACASLPWFALVTPGAIEATTPAQAESEGGPSPKSEPPTDEPQDWAPRASGYLYLTPDGDYLQPTIAIDHQWLHLEARYNYEDRSTVSMWIGYNFSVGSQVTLEITPMLGGVLGNTDGIAPGYEGTLTWRWLELYSESEYVFSTGDRSNSFLYNWSTLTASATDWLRLGVVVQRTRAYATSREVQRGFLVGVSTKHVGMTGYMFNPDLDRPTYVFALDVNW